MFQQLLWISKAQKSEHKNNERDSEIFVLVNEKYFLVIEKSVIKGQPRKLRGNIYIISHMFSCFFCLEGIK